VKSNNFEIERFLHFKPEIRNLILDNPMGRRSSGKFRSDLNFLISALKCSGVNPESETPEQERMNNGVSTGRFMKKTKSPQVFTREFKIAAVRRVLGGEQLGTVARKLGVSYERLWRWKKRVVEQGEQHLNKVGRPRGRGQPNGDEGQGRRIEELERLVGRQQLEIGFLDKALRRVEELRQPKRNDGGMGSLKR
jgi:transposase-like protein